MHFLYFLPDLLIIPSATYTKLDMLFEKKNNYLFMLPGEDKRRILKMNPNLDLPGKESHRPSQVNLSPYVTVVAFDPLIPLARIPVLAGQEENPSNGPYVLAFRNEETWRQSWRTCKENIVTQCEAGAKVGCSISAAKACRPPWWKVYLPFLRSGFYYMLSFSCVVMLYHHLPKLDLIEFVAIQIVLNFVPKMNEFVFI